MESSRRLGLGRKLRNKLQDLALGLATDALEQLRMIFWRQERSDKSQRA